MKINLINCGLKSSLKTQPHASMPEQPYEYIVSVFVRQKFSCEEIPQDFQPIIRKHSQEEVKGGGGGGKTTRKTMYTRALSLNYAYTSDLIIYFNTS